MFSIFIFTSTLSCQCNDHAKTSEGTFLKHIEGMEYWSRSQSLYDEVLNLCLMTFDVHFRGPSAHIWSGVATNDPVGQKAPC